MKKLLIGVLTIALIIPLVLGGCADTDTTDTTDTTTTDTTDTTTTDTTDTTTTEPIEFRLTTHQTDTTLYQEWADKVAEETEGRVTITIYPSSTLMEKADVISGVSTGIADIGDVVVSDLADQFPLSCILSLPCMPLGDTETSCQIWGQLIDEFPELAAEYGDFKLLFWIATSGSSIVLHTTDEQVLVPEDIEGLKIMPPGTLLGEALSDIGAASLDLSPSDWYTSLDTGLLEGMLMSWQGVYFTQCYTLMPYHTIFPSGTMFGQGVMIMNVDSFNKMSAEDQQVFEDLFDWMSERWWQSTDDENAMIIEAIEAEGHSIVTLTSEQEELWYDATSAVREAYLADLDAQGLPATEIYERAIELAAEYAD